MTITTEDIDVTLSGDRVRISGPSIAALTEVKRAELAAYLLARFPDAEASEGGCRVFLGVGHRAGVSS